jgi:hypothetical protein
MINNLNKCRATLLDSKTGVVWCGRIDMGYFQAALKKIKYPYRVMPSACTYPNNYEQSGKFSLNSMRQTSCCGLS